MKNLNDLKNDLDKSYKKFLKKSAEDVTNKYLASIKDEIAGEKGHFEVEEISKNKVQIIPKGFSNELTVKINSLLPKL